MALVVIVTRDVPDRFRGFLASVMLEVAPTVYISPRMNQGVRTRTWKVLMEWHKAEPRGSIVMVWRDIDQFFNKVTFLNFTQAGPRLTC